MRRKDRGILQKAQIAELIGRCQTVRMGMSGDDFPYIVPLSFGFEMRGERLIVYFHCAAEGKKLDLLARNNKVCLEWDILHGYAEVGNALMAEYESAIAFGRAQRCEGAERVNGLRLLLEHTGFSDIPRSGAPICPPWKCTASNAIALRESAARRSKARDERGAPYKCTIKMRSAFISIRRRRAQGKLRAPASSSARSWRGRAREAERPLPFARRRQNIKSPMIPWWQHTKSPEKEESIPHGMLSP